MDLEALLAQLNDLDTVEDLGPLENDLTGAYKDVRKQPITDESVKQLQALAEGIKTVRTTAAARVAKAAELETTVSQLDTEVVGDTKDAVPDEAKPTDEPKADEPKADEVVAEATADAPVAADAPAPAPAGALAVEDTPAPTADAPAPTPAADAAPEVTPAAETVTAAGFDQLNQNQPPNVRVKSEPAPAGRVAAFAAMDVRGVDDKPVSRQQVLETMARRLSRMGTTRPGESEDVGLFSLLDTEHPDNGGSGEEADRRLTMDPRANQEIIDREMAPHAVVAAGGSCAPRTPSYKFIHLGQNNEPLRGSIPSFPADRGGVTIPESNDITSVGTPDSGPSGAAAGSPHQAVDFLTMAQDSSGYTKVYQEFDCVTYTPYDVGAETFYTQHGVMNKKFFPELIAHDLDNAEDAHARFSETKILRLFDAFSKVKLITHNQNVDVSTELLNVVSQYADQRRSYYRMAVNAPVRVWLPFFVVGMIQRGFSLKVGDADPAQLALTQQAIEAWFKNRNINVTWHYDGYLPGEVFGAQTNSAAMAGDPTVVWIRMFHEGAVGLLDGGQEDFGIVRDSALIKTNKYQQFRERFWNLMMPGIWGARIRLTVCANGASAGTIDPNLLCDGGS